jgi:S-(hydroxymethyl)glutathione dehydrogenase/alcohol dehydrogenase
MGNVGEYGIPVSLFELAMYQKRIQGSLFGMMQPTRAIEDMLRFYREGHLMLEELITRRYPLEEINQGYRDMHAGTNLRGVIDF